MKVQYFADTDTLYIEFRERDIIESKDLDENTILDLDAERNNVRTCKSTHRRASFDGGRDRGVTSAPPATPPHSSHGRPERI